MSLTSFSFCPSLPSTVWHLEDRWKYENTISETRHLLAPHPNGHRPSAVDKRLITTAPSLCGVTQYFYLLFLSYRRYLSVLLVDNYESIAISLAAWERRGILSRADKVKDSLPRRRWIRRRIARPGIYGRLSLLLF